MGTKREITLIDQRGNSSRWEGQDFLIESIRGSISYIAGSYLTAEQVQDLLDYGNWSILIKTDKGGTHYG